MTILLQVVRKAEAYMVSQNYSILIDSLLYVKKRMTERTYAKNQIK